MGDSSGLTLVGVGVPQPLIAEAAAASGLPWAPVAAGGAGTAAEIVLFPTSRRPVPEGFWGSPRRGWIAVQEEPVRDIAARVRRALDFALFASVATRDVDALGLPAGICRAIAARITTTPEKIQDIELAVHEAVSNAVLHGNLVVNSIDDLSVSALDRFGAAYTGRMADPAFGLRLVEVGCVLTAEGAVVEVADQGHGFQPAQCRQTKASGRGLRMIEGLTTSVELVDGGRRIRMRFAL